MCMCDGALKRRGAGLDSSQRLSAVPSVLPGGANLPTCPLPLASWLPCSCCSPDSQSQGQVSLLLDLHTSIPMLSQSLT